MVAVVNRVEPIGRHNLLKRPNDNFHRMVFIHDDDDDDDIVQASNDKLIVYSYLI